MCVECLCVPLCIVGAFSSVLVCVCFVLFFMTLIAKVGAVCVFVCLSVCLSVVFWCLC